MKPSFFIFPLLTMLLLAGCSDSDTQPPRKHPSMVGAGDTEFTTNSAMTNSTLPPEGTTDTNGLVTNPVATPTNPFSSPSPVPVATPNDLPYATPVPGKPGIVINPYAPSNAPDKDRLIDVRDFPPGSEARDPVSGKIFLVP